MVVKMNLNTLTKNHEAVPEIGFLTKSISKPYGRSTAMPPAWELKLKVNRIFGSHLTDLQIHIIFSDCIKYSFKF